MRVVVKSNFDVGALLGQDALELQEGCSMRSLLDLLSQQCRVNLIDPKSGRVNVTDFTLVLNGKEYPFWPQGLDTGLRDADEVQIFLMPLGGG